MEETNNIKEFNKSHNGYMAKGKTDYTDNIGWDLNCNYSLFNNYSWNDTNQYTDHINFTLSDYAWYPEMYDYDIDVEEDISQYIAKYPNTTPDNTNTNKLSSLIVRTPTITLTAFKPNLSDLQSLISLFTVMYKVGSAIFSTDSKALKIALKNAFDSTNITNTLKKAVNQAAFINVVDETRTENNFSMFYNAVNAFYRRLVAGVYMTKYTLPFYNSNLYLKSNPGTWGYKSLFGDLNFLQELIGSVDIMTTVTWDSKGSTGINGTTGFDAINFEFSLFNRKATDVYRNLKFIHTLIPEALWMQDGIFQIPGTVYDVEIPGRTRFYWCTAEFKCEYRGKTRYFTAYTPDYLYYTQNTTPDISQHPNITPNLDTNIAINATNQKIRDLNLIPDAYKVSVTLNSLLPNNLNTYLYGLFESKNAVPSYGEGVDRLIPNFIKGYTVNLLKGGFENAVKDSSISGDVKTVNTLNETLTTLNSII